MPQGNPDPAFFDDIIPRYSRMLGRLGFSKIIPFRALGVGPGSDVLGNEDISRSINDTVHNIIAG